METIIGTTNSEDTPKKSELESRLPDLNSLLPIFLWVRSVGPIRPTGLISLFPHDSASPDIQPLYPPTPYPSLFPLLPLTRALLVSNLVSILQV